MKVMMLKMVLATIIVLHFAVIFAHMLAFFFLPFFTPWYVSLPICGYILNLMTSPGTCVLTAAEDKVRRKLGMPPIKLFIKHYVIKPAIRIKRSAAASLARELIGEFLHYMLEKRRDAK